MAPLHMPVLTTEMLLATSNEFYLVWNFPNCVGSTDGKHIRLKCPSNSGSMYYNYKNYYSIVLQGLADARYIFIAIDVGAYGKQSDGGIFRHSSLYQLLSSNNFNMPNARKLPLSDVELLFHIPEDSLLSLGNFNYRLSRCRRVVERAYRNISKYGGQDCKMCMCFAQHSHRQRRCRWGISLGITKPRRFIQDKSWWTCTSGLTI